MNFSERQNPAERERDVLANMMGADSRRIDGLVEDVGAIRGDMQSVRSKVNDVGDGVNELRNAMAVLVKHEVLMEQAGATLTNVTLAHAKLDERLQTIEKKAPGWDEARTWVLRAGLGVLGVVGLAMVGLVLKIGGAG